MARNHCALSSVTTSAATITAIVFRPALRALSRAIEVSRSARKGGARSPRVRSRSSLVPGRPTRRWTAPRRVPAVPLLATLADSSEGLPPSVIAPESGPWRRLPGPGPSAGTAHPGQRSPPLPSVSGRFPMVNFHPDPDHGPGEGMLGVDGDSCGRGDDGGVVRYARSRSRHCLLQRRRAPGRRSPLEWFFRGGLLSHHPRDHGRGPRSQSSSRHQARCADLLDRGKRRDRPEQRGPGEHAGHGERLNSYQGVLRHHWMSPTPGPERTQLCVMSGIGGEQSTSTNLSIVRRGRIATHRRPGVGNSAVVNAGSGN